MCNNEKEILLSVIDMYKDMPHLWQRDHKSYKNKKVRADGFNELLEVYKNFDRFATIKTLKKKIDNMKTNYDKELRKVLASKATGNEIYIPTLWYFNTFSFLDNRSKTYSSMSVPDPLQISNPSSDDESVISPISVSVPKKRKKEEIVVKKEKFSLARESIAKKEEDWEVYGKSIGLQMKDLNKTQMIITQKLISDVIFYAKLDRLTESSSIFTPIDEFQTES